jgi:predicted AlkP superfamily phosphohydrolase/phosphomutase
MRLASGLGRLGAACLTVAIAVTVGAASPGCSRKPRTDRRVIVLGIDGMDYGLTRELMAQGRMPNFSKLAKAGSFTPLATTFPPQSPVAWSSFITGEDSGQHGIFDFVHRDPGTMLPFLSTTRTAPGRSVKLGDWQFPITSGRVELLRKGSPFWNALSRNGYETTIIRMPANFPPSGTATHELSGMGTPDIRGTYGTYSFFTSDPGASDSLPASGGSISRVVVRDGEVHGTLAGPDNPYRVETEKVTASFVAYIDAREPMAKIAVGGEERILKVGEWSDWVPIAFKLAPLQTLHGIGRFYLKQIRPNFELYVSPINLDPLEPAMPVSTPRNYAAELSAATGRFYTQGMPEDTKALSQGALTRDEFLAQARLAQAENLTQYRYVLNTFRQGLLFYYFGNLDQVSHMMWRARDPGHPAYDAARDGPYAHVIDNLYADFDAIVGDTLAKMPADATLIVMSDHGFTTWRRAFNLNAWLEQNGYLTVIDPDRRDAEVFANVDWTRTRAYGLGLNGLYVNVRGREHDGIVPAESREALAREIAAKLERFIDPSTGQAVVLKAYRREDIYSQMNFPALAPDLVIGYAGGTRVSNESALGAVSRDVLTDNRDEWSGDHCIDPRVVPGVLFTSRPLHTSADSLQHLAAAIMAEFGIDGGAGG